MNKEQGERIAATIIPYRGKDVYTLDVSNAEICFGLSIGAV